MIQTVANLASYVNLIFNPLIHFFTFKIAPFLGNDYIFDGNMGAMLQNIWIINRNIVNIVFVLVLLYLALKHIISGEDSNIAKTLPKFAIMLVAINFSWLAGRIVLDAANVAANVVFAIPAGISPIAGDSFQQVLDKNPCKIGSDNKTTNFCEAVPEASFIVLDANKTYNYLNTDSECNNPTNIKTTDEAYLKNYPTSGKAPDVPDAAYSKTNRICCKQMNLSDYQQNNASYYLSYSMARVQNLIRSDQNDLTNTAVGTLFSLALQIAYLAGFISLFIVLIMRAAMMWLLMAFSPYIFLLWYFEWGNIKVGGVEEAKKYLSKEAFLQWAFVPAKVGAVWTIGFIMVTAGQTMTSSAFEKITTHIYGAGTLFQGMDTVQQFIWFMMTLGIVWVGTFAVFANLGVASKITESIKSTVQGAAMGGAKGLGANLPIFPVMNADGKGGMHGGTWNEAKKDLGLKTFGGEKTSTSSETGITNDGTKVINIMTAAKAFEKNSNEENINKLIAALREGNVKSLADLQTAENTKRINDSKALSEFKKDFESVLSGKAMEDAKKATEAKATEEAAKKPQDLKPTVDVPNSAKPK